MDTKLFFEKKIQTLFAVGAIAILISTTNALAASGLLDPTFGTNGLVISDLASDPRFGSDIALQPDGRIIMLVPAQGGQMPTLMRYNSNGSVDNTFGASGKLTLNFGSKVALQSDGKLVVAGSSNLSFAVARYGNNGANLDNTFGTNGVATLPADPGNNRYFPSDLAIESDGKIVVAGTQYNQGNFINLVLARFNSDGTRYDTDTVNGFIVLDHPNFPNSRYNTAQAVAIQADGKIVMSGGMMDEDANGQISLVRFNQDSSIDTATFGTNGKGTVTAAVPGFHFHKSSMVLQADGKIVVIGTASDRDDLHNELVAARFNSNGALDTTFGGTGIVITDFGANEFGMDVHLQTDGRIVVVGKSSTPESDNLLIVRYNKDGSLDGTFSDGGKLIGNFGSGPSSGAGIEIQPDGKIVIAGSSNGNAFLARYVIVTGAPITTTFKSAGAYDGWVLESGENSNVGGTLEKVATTFNVGDDLRDRQYRSIISINTSTLPDTAIVTAVQLSIKKQGVVGTDPFTTHGDLLADLRDSSFSNNFILQAGDFSAAASPGASQELIPYVPINNWITINLRNGNLGFVSKVGVTQFRLFFSLDDNDDLGADYLKFFSGNSTSANMPQLIVTYYKP